MDKYKIIYSFNGVKDVCFISIANNPYLTNNDIIDSLKLELYKYLGTSKGVSILSIDYY